jgi:hypothetical protein
MKAKKSGTNPITGLKKKTDNSTSYGTKPVYHSSSVKNPSPAKISTVSNSSLKEVRAKQGGSSLYKKKK